MQSQQAPTTIQPTSGAVVVYSVPVTQSPMDSISSIPNKSTKIESGKLLTPGEAATVTDGEVASFINDMVEGWDADLLPFDAVYELMSFQGFDPKIVYKKLLVVKRSLGITDAIMRKDLFVLLILQHIKGNVNANNAKSMSQQAQTATEFLFKRYGIQLKVTEEKKLSITLPRLAGAFPFQASQIAAKYNREFAGPYDSHDLPACIKTVSFCSLIPLASPITNFMMLVYTAFATDQTIAIRKVDQELLTPEAKKKYFDRQKEFSELSLKTPTVSNKFRKWAMIRLGLAPAFMQFFSVFSKTQLYQQQAVSQVTWDNAFSDWATETSGFAPGNPLVPTPKAPSQSGSAPPKTFVTPSGQVMSSLPPPTITVTPYIAPESQASASSSSAPVPVGTPGQVEAAPGIPNFDASNAAHMGEYKRLLIESNEPNPSNDADEAFKIQAVQNIIDGKAGVAPSRSAFKSFKGKGKSN